MDENKSEDIYDILGIDSTKTSDGSYNTKVGDTSKGEYLDLNAPTGYIFDDYSKYPKEPDNYWWYFRLWTFMGIGVVALLFIAGIVAFMSTGSQNYNDEVEEVICTDTPDDYAVEEVEVAEVVADVKVLSGLWYFSGTKNDKYAIHMYLDFDTHSGKYYYVRSGSDNCMALEITDIMERDNQYILKMTEYNPSGKMCGMWSGTLIDESFTGYYALTLASKPKPFDLQKCNSYETDF